MTTGRINQVTISHTNTEVDATATGVYTLSQLDFHYKAMYTSFVDS